jgi:hypothetical protein
VADLPFPYNLPPPELPGTCLLDPPAVPEAPEECDSREVPAIPPDICPPPPPLPIGTPAGPFFRQSQPAPPKSLRYGPSDSTAPSFNYPAYVRWFAAQESLFLGPVPAGGLKQEGLIGARAGTQSLFFSFEISQASRVSVRLAPLNPYTDQYVALGLRDPLDRPIPLDGGASLASFQAGSDAVAPDLSASPPGAYLVILSSSQWPEVPFRLEVFARPIVQELRAAVDLPLDVDGRLGLINLTALTALGVDALGAASRTVNLGKGPYLGYVDQGYWQSGYAENDDQFEQIPQLFELGLDGPSQLEIISR